MSYCYQAYRQYESKWAVAGRKKWRGTIWNDEQHLVLISVSVAFSSPSFRIHWTLETKHFCRERLRHKGNWHRVDDEKWIAIVSLDFHSPLFAFFWIHNPVSGSVESFIKHLSWTIWTILIAFVFICLSKKQCHFTLQLIFDAADENSAQQILVFLDIQQSFNLSRETPLPTFSVHALIKKMFDQGSPNMERGRKEAKITMREKQIQKHFSAN